ncbi:MAG TPA: hypothetical protein DDW93_02740, partial [Firmicutes bacterium]|nr:hypothetical protein [Bacillota bacterium]
PRDEAVTTLSRVNLTYRGLGSGGYVIAQSPKAGVMVKPKTTILLY